MGLLGVIGSSSKGLKMALIMELLKSDIKRVFYDVFTEFVLKEICAGSSLESEFWDEFLAETFLNS